MKRLLALSIACFASAGAVAAGGQAPQGAARASIERTFDRHKGGFYAIYGRALRENPNLAGKVVLDIDIAASGAVSDCRVVSSELPRELAAKFCERVRQIQFEPQQASSTLRKPLDFFPAG